MGRRKTIWRVTTPSDDEEFGEEVDNVDQHAEKAADTPFWVGSSRRSESVEPGQELCDKKETGKTKHKDKKDRSHYWVIMRRTCQFSRFLYEKYRKEDPSTSARSKLKQAFRAAHHGSRTVVQLDGFLSLWCNEARQRQLQAFKQQQRETENEWTKVTDWLGQVTQNVAESDVEISVTELLATVTADNQELHDISLELKHASSQLSREFTSLLKHCNCTLVQSDTLCDEINEVQESVRSMLANFMSKIEDVKECVKRQSGTDKSSHRRNACLMDSCAINFMTAAKSMRILKQIGNKVEDATLHKSMPTFRGSVPIIYSSTGSEKGRLVSAPIMEKEECETWHNASGGSDSDDEESSTSSESAESHAYDDLLASRTKSVCSTLSKRGSADEPNVDFRPSSLFSRPCTFFESMLPEAPSEYAPGDDGLRAAVHYMNWRSKHPRCSTAKVPVSLRKAIEPVVPTVAKSRMARPRVQARMLIPAVATSPLHFEVDTECSLKEASTSKRALVGTWLEGSFPSIPASPGRPLWTSTPTSPQSVAKAFSDTWHSDRSMRTTARSIALPPFETLITFSPRMGGAPFQMPSNVVR